MSTALRTYYRGADLVAMRDEVNLTTRYYQFDHQGTTQCLTDETGAVMDRFASDAWGVPVKRTGSTINRQWYVGNSGYYRGGGADYIRARYYVPGWGAFGTRDPVGTYASRAKTSHPRRASFGRYDRADDHHLMSAVNTIF